MWGSVHPILERFLLMASSDDKKANSSLEFMSASDFEFFINTEQYTLIYSEVFNAVSKIHVIKHLLLWYCFMIVPPIATESIICKTKTRHESETYFTNLALISFFASSSHRITVS